MAYEDDGLVPLQTSGFDLTHLKGCMGAAEQRRAQGSGGCSYIQMSIKIRMEEFGCIDCRMPTRKLSASSLELGALETQVLRNYK